METRSLPPSQTDYDLFLSYAHSDDVGGLVTALHEQLERDFQQLLQRPVNIFLDRSDIRDFDHWKVRCHRALRASRFFIVLLSPAYLTSDACRWEWEEWLKRELERGQVGTGAACLWFIELAKLDAPGDAERLRQWKNELRQRFGVTFHAWHQGGREALQDAAARTELARLTEHVAQRLRLLALDRSQRGNLGWPQDRFVGREPELRRLREGLLDAPSPAPLALVGVGGMGKTALALTFAYREAGAFPGGCWLLRCEGQARLDAALRPLVQDLGLELTEREKLDDTLAARRVLATLRSRGTALLLLDNVDTPALLAPDQLALLDQFQPPVGADVRRLKPQGSQSLLTSAPTDVEEPSLTGESSLRLLVTTREAPAAFAAVGARIRPIDLDQLPEDHALDLIRLYQPDAAFASAAGEADAREIVRALGGLTLAVETAAVYLGQNDARVADPRYAVRMADYLEKLRRDLAGTGEAEPGVRPGDAIRQLREVAATLRPTLARLDAPTRTVLQLAALLPPDALPLPWLRAVAGQLHPELAKDADIAKRDEWTDLIRALIGMRLLQPTSEPLVFAVHRLLQRVLDAELREGREGLAGFLETHLATRARSIYRAQAAPSDWELDALLIAAPHWLATHPVRDLANASVFMSEKVVTYRTLPAAASFLATVHGVIERLAASDPANAAWQRDLSVSLDKLGDLAVAQGDLAGALRCFTQSQTIAERLAASDPANAVWQFDLGISNERLGDLAVAQGKLDEALVFHTKRKDIINALAASDPANAAWQRDLSVSLNRLGELAVAQGDLAGALRRFTECHAIFERLAASDPANAAWQRDLSVSLNKLGDLAVAQGDLAGALRRFTESEDIAERLAASDPANAEWQRDLCVSLNNLGELAVAQGDLAGALRRFTESKDIFERLAASDPANAAWQCDLLASKQRLGDLAVAQGNLESARRYLSESLEAAQKLADADRSNAEWERNVLLLLVRLGGLAVTRGDLAGAWRYFNEAKVIAERLAASDPANAEWQRDLSVSLNKLGDLAVAQDDLAGAFRRFTECHAILERLRSVSPTTSRSTTSGAGSLRW
jgi:tetratricopeptide (TPR) repeat protein